MSPNATPSPLTLVLLDSQDHHEMSQFDTTALAFQLPIALPGADLDTLLGETNSYEMLISRVTTWRDRARLLTPSPQKVATMTKRDEELTALDREGGWISSTHATDGEGKPITTFQKLVPQEDRVYGPLVDELERFIVFLSRGHEQGALLSRVETQATLPPPAPVQQEAPAPTTPAEEALASTVTAPSIDEVAQ